MDMRGYKKEEEEKSKTTEIRGCSEGEHAKVW